MFIYGNFFGVDNIVFIQGKVVMFQRMDYSKVFDVKLFWDFFELLFFLVDIRMLKFMVYEVVKVGRLKDIYLKFVGSIFDVIDKVM